MHNKELIRRIKFYVLVALVLISLSLGLFSDALGVELQAGSLEDDVASMLIFLAWIIVSAITTIPIAAFMVAGIFLFSFTQAIVLTVLGTFIGASITYLFTVWLGKDYYESIDATSGKRVQRLKKLIDVEHEPLLVLMNFFYFFPSTIAYVVAGVSKVPYNRFIVIMLLGNTLNFFFTGLLFYGLRIQHTPYIVGSLCVLVLTSAIPLLMYRDHFKEILAISLGR